MKRFRLVDSIITLLAIEIILSAALTASAQQPAGGPGGADKTEQLSSQAGMPEIEQQLKVLTEKLVLTAEQQARIKPVIEQMNDATQKLMQDESMSHEERLASLRASRERADKQIRKLLNDDQQKKLDQLEREPHPELHGNLNGDLPTVEKQLKVLAEKLALTADQQAKFKPIFQELNDATQKLLQDESLSHEARLDKVRALREQADKRIRAILNDDQQKKLDQLEQQPHPELHGSLNGATQPPQ